MKALLGGVSLLIALAVVGLVAVKQLKAVGRAGGSTAAAASEAGVATLQRSSGSGTGREQTQPLQNKVADDVAKAMGQAAAARKEEADKP